MSAPYPPDQPYPQQPGSQPYTNYPPYQAPPSQPYSYGPYQPAPPSQPVPYQPPPSQPYPYQQPYQQPMMVQPIYVQAPPQQSYGMAVAMEVILALFGVYGVGWLMAGKTNIGIPLIIGGFVWDLIVIVMGVLTVGFGFCCLVPIHFGLIATSAIVLAGQLKRP